MFYLLAQLQVVKPRKVEATLEPCAMSLPMHGHAVRGLGSTGLGHRIGEFFGDQFDARAPGICSRSPEAFAEMSDIQRSSETATISTWF